jgi:hypothetical protein
VLALSSNQTALLAAGIAALTSVVTTLVAVRFGPNYHQKIADLNSAVAELTATLHKWVERQSKLVELDEQRFLAESAAEWRPDVRVEDSDSETTLVLKGDREFGLHRVTLESASGAVVESLPNRNWQITSTGFRFPIPVSEMQKLCEYVGIPAKCTRAEAAIGYEISMKDGSRRSLILKVILKAGLRPTGAYVEIIS